MKYVLQRDEKSACPCCNTKVDLLCEAFGKSADKWFYICWTCKRVFQLGHGEVPREDN